MEWPAAVRPRPCVPTPHPHLPLAFSSSSLSLMLVRSTTAEVCFMDAPPPNLLVPVASSSPPSPLTSPCDRVWGLMRVGGWVGGYESGDGGGGGGEGGWWVGAAGASASLP